MNTADKTGDDKASAHCGSKPKKLAIGIAPLGTISIGIVPMGVVCIGVVPMGVVSIGVVAMGVWTAGPLSMGLVSLGGSEIENSHQHHLPVSGKSSSQTDPRLMAYPTQLEAEAKARELGCKGAHQMGTHWMPCDQHSQH